MDLTLQFLLMVEGPADRSDIIDCIRASFPDSSPQKVNSCKLRNNLIDVWGNPDADKLRLADPAEAYLFFAYRVECTPLVDVSERDQIALAKLLLAALSEAGWKVVPCANFEDQL